MKRMETRDSCSFELSTYKGLRGKNNRTTARGRRVPYSPPHPPRASLNHGATNGRELKHVEIEKKEEKSHIVPASWPTAEARKSLYSSLTVPRVEGMHLHVKGTLPKWLKGSLYRNGPGFFEGAHAVFDGCAVIFKFHIDGQSNSVICSHRFLESNYYAAAKQHGKIKLKLAHSKSDPTEVLHSLKYAGELAKGALKYGMQLGDNALVSIFPQGDELIARTETAAGTYSIDPESLKTLERIKYQDNIHGLVTSAHPHFHPTTGDSINLACDFTPTFLRDESATLKIHRFRVPEITVYRQPADSPRVRIPVASLPYLQPTSPTWIHQMGVSTRYAIVIQNPVLFDIRSMLLGESGEYMAFKWQPELGSLIHIVPLENREAESRVKTFKAPAFLVTHVANSFEEGPFIHLDVAVSENPGIMSHWSLETVGRDFDPPSAREIPSTRLRRLTIDTRMPEGASLDQKTFLRPLIRAPDEEYGSAFELPNINPAFAGKPYRFIYGASCVRPTNCWNALVKFDILAEPGKQQVWRWHEGGGACWEPIFVPAPNGKREDEGVIVTVYTQPDGKTALLVLDAMKFTEIARAVLPYGIPNGFHGCWVPD